MAASTPILNGAYEVVGVVPGPIGYKNFGIVDLSKLTPAKAEQLVKAGCPYLRKVKVPVKEKPVEAEKKKSGKADKAIE